MVAGNFLITEAFFPAPMAELPPDVKAQLEEQKANCIFCKIISGEMATNKVYEDDLVFACLDINPAVTGHMLVMPKEHYPLTPLIPLKTFAHLFGLVPELVKAQLSGLAKTGVTVYIANGAAAGQQSQHFLFHLLPREKQDGLALYFMTGKASPEKQEEAVRMLATNLPLMMKNFFARNPAKWHSGQVDTPAFLKEVKASQKLVYEDEKVLCVSPEKPLIPGHIVFYSKEEEKDITKLSRESASHLFLAASLASSAVFDGLKAQATTIILKSGSFDDNPDQRLTVHVLPRSVEDGLKLQWEPERGKDLNSVADKITDKTVFIGKREEAKAMQTIEFPQPEVIRDGGKSAVRGHEQKERKPLSPYEEIERAIREASSK